MSLVVNTNIGSLNAQRLLTSSSNELATAMERLSSGKKINSAADDAAGFAIAERMAAQVRGLNMATKNINDGLSMLAVVENASSEVTDMLQRIRELAVQAANDTNSSTDRGYLQKEVDSLVSEIDRIASQTKYNDNSVLTGFYESNSLQVGTEGGQTVSFSIAATHSSQLGVASGFGAASSLGFLDGTSLSANGSKVEIELSAYSGAPSTVGHVVNHNNWFGSSWSNSNPDSTYQAQKAFVNFEDGSSYALQEYMPSPHGNYVAVEATLSEIQAKVGQQWSVSGGGISQLDVTSASNAATALTTVTSAIEELAADRAGIGALQNRLEYTVSNLMNVAEFTAAARSRIEDADFAAESARLAKAQVLQQTGTAMLAQANSSSQLVLSLIR
jgi:flagellin